MLNNFCIKLVGWLMNRDLSTEQMNKLTIYIMGNLGNLPIRDIIYLNKENQLVVNRKIVDLEKMRQLREHARIALDNKAIDLIKKQISFIAIANGIHKAERPEQLIFNRAAIWYHQQFDNYLSILAQIDNGQLPPNPSED